MTDERDVPDPDELQVDESVETATEFESGDRARRYVLEERDSRTDAVFVALDELLRSQGEPTPSPEGKPLDEVVDRDTLDDLLSGNAESDECVTFTYLGRRVAVTADGQILVSEPGQADRAQTN